MPAADLKTYRTREEAIGAAPKHDGYEYYVIRVNRRYGLFRNDQSWAELRDEGLEPTAVGVVYGDTFQSFTGK